MSLTDLTYIQLIELPRKANCNEGQQ